MKLADFVTLTNALCGVGAILLLLDEFTYLAPTLILIAAVADGVDGHLSRCIASSDIGGNLDSLADVISFGLAPIVILYSFNGDKGAYLLVAALCFYFLCGILRLARFNTVQSSFSSFSGLPITAGGIVLSSYVLMGERYFNTYLAIIIALSMGILMISTITYQKARQTKLLIIIALIFAAIIVSFAFNMAYGHFFAIILMILMTLYVISPVIKKTT
ncbi:archaetidylserine synthase [Methanolobus sp. ZRKC3]|uniref:archaetidylserine synthase n=1 Tax=Methanolobus sp. ZRKC3 TaxID=3125786 RepID=UPI00324D17BF